MDELGESYEAILVNDGSSDATGQLIDESSTDWPQARPIHFAQNVGQAGALLRGLQAAAGQWIFTIDGDGQHDLADFHVLLGARSTGDLVIGIRQPRHDSWLRRAMSRLANSVRGWMLQDHVTDTGCALKLFRREVVDSLIPIRTLYSFIPAMAVNRGFRVVEVPVRHLPRLHGKSSYGLSVFFWKPAADMLALWWLFQRRIPRDDLDEAKGNGDAERGQTPP
jgi:glycosyltransferase involved in cell wall biosynthesis